jgi:hypothetical protein
MSQDPKAQYLGVEVNIASNDGAKQEFLEAAGQGRLTLQQCSDCQKLRYPVMTACPFCTSLDSTWADVSGKGTIYSYELVMHPIHPVSSLVDAEGNPEHVDNVAINARVEVEFADLGDGLALPRFRLSAEPPEGDLWRFPG